jgi:hypothetical protein
MANLNATFSAKSDAYKAEIQAAAKALDDLPKAQQRIAQKMQAIAAKSSDDQVKLRELAVLKEIQAIQKLASKTPELYGQAEEAKKKIIERYAKERIEIEERTNNAVGSSLKKIRPALAGVVQVTNSVGAAAGAVTSQFTGMATGVLGAFANGNGAYAAMAGFGAVVALVASHFKEVSEREAEAAKRIEEDFKKRWKEANDLGNEYARAIRLQNFLLGGGSEAQFNATEKQAGEKAAFGAQGNRVVDIQGRISGLIGQRAALMAAGPRSESAAVALPGKLAEIEAQIRDLQRRFVDEAQLLGRAGFAEMAGRGIFSDQGPPIPTIGNGGVKTGGGKSEAQRQREIVDAAAAAEVDNMAKLSREINARVRARSQKLDFTDDTSTGSLMDQIAISEREQGIAQAGEKRDAELAKERAKRLAEITAKESQAAMEKKFAEDAKSAALLQAGIVTGETLAEGIVQGIANKLPADDNAAAIFHAISSAVGVGLAAINPAAGAAFGSFTGIFGFRKGGGPGLPQARGGLPAGVNYDAHGAHWEHPEEFTWSREGVAGAGGADKVARMHDAARAGRFGDASGGQVNIYLPTLAPADAAAMVKDLVEPGMLQLMSNHRSQILAKQVVRAGSAPRSR